MSAEEFITFELAKAPASIEELGSVHAAIAALVHSVKSSPLERVEVKGFEKGWFSSKYTLKILYGTGVFKEATVEGRILSLPAVIYNAASSDAQRKFMDNIPRMAGGARRHRSHRRSRKSRRAHTRRRR